jgi:hypothetical protein
MAMAGAVLGLRVAGVIIENVQTTAKTLPQFTSRWTQMLQDGRDAPPAREIGKEDARPLGDGPGNDESTDNHEPGGK